MKKKNTDGLQQELMDSPDLTLFLSQNQEQFVNKSVSELLNHLFEEKNILPNLLLFVLVKYPFAVAMIVFLHLKP